MIIAMMSLMLIVIRTLKLMTWMIMIKVMIMMITMMMRIILTKKMTR